MTLKKPFLETSTIHYLKDSPDPGIEPKGALKVKKDQKAKKTYALFQHLKVILGGASGLSKYFGKGSE